MFLEEFEDPPCDHVMLFDCLCEDQDVIQIDHYNSFHDEFVEDIVHHGLECGWAVGKAKEHHQRFEEAMIGAKGSFPLISFLHSDIVEAPSNI